MSGASDCYGVGHQSRPSKLHCTDATIHFDFRSGHKIRFIGRKVQDSVRDIIGLPDAADRNLPPQFLQRCLPVPALRHAVENRCIDEYRMYRIAANVVAGASAMQRDGFRQVSDSGLGRVVGCQVMAGNDAGYRGNVNDGSAAVLRAQRYPLLSAEEHTVEIDSMYAPPVFVRLIFDTGNRTDARIIHEDVQATEISLHLA